MTTTEVQQNSTNGTEPQKPARARPKKNPHADTGKEWAAAQKRVDDAELELAEARSARAEILKRIQETSK